MVTAGVANADTDEFSPLEVTFLAKFTMLSPTEAFIANLPMLHN